MKHFSGVTRACAATLLAASMVAPVSGATPPTAPSGPEFSQHYTAEVAGQRLPVLMDYEKAARKLDQNRDQVLSSDEFAVTAKELPGRLKVDLDDYSVGVAHEFTGTPSSFAFGYPSSAEVEARMRELQAAHPEKTALISLGSTAEGRTILALRVSRNDGQPRPKVAVIAQQHAREWVAHQVALTSVETLLTEPSQADLLDSFEFWFVPLANPDGYEYSRLVEPMWRKNRRGSTEREAHGVDLNRNFDAEFRRQGDSPESSDDDWGASDRPYSAQYRGAGAASEPETRELQALLELPDMVGVVDVHGFGCKIVLPNQTQVSDGVYQEAAQSMLEALGTDFEIIRYQDLYPVTGHLPAFADGRGIVAITLEVGGAFQPHPSKIEGIASLGTRGVLAFARSLAVRQGSMSL